MARPKTDEEKKLSKVVLFRVTDSEMSQLETASEACGQTIGQLVRVKVFKGKFPQPVLPKTDQRTVIELNKIGVNINQAVRTLNAGIWPQDLRSLLTRAIWLLERFLDELLRDDCKSEDR